METSIFAQRLAAAMLVTTIVVPAAQAAKLDLSTYKVTSARTLGSYYENGSETPEASAVTYNWDSGSLLVLGDEGAGGNEYTTSGDNQPGVFQYRATVTPTRGNLFNDSEGITYIGNGQYIVAEERTTKLLKVGIDHSRTLNAGPSGNNENIYYFTAPDPAFSYNVSGGANWGNTGLEGISYDQISGGFFGIKSANGQRVMYIDWDFNTANSAGTTVDLFDASLLGLTTLSDISTLSNVTAFSGKDFSQNLLILSSISEMLLEVTRTGEIVSRFDLSGILSDDGNVKLSGIEGVTLDNEGNIYLVGERGGIGVGSHFIKLERQQVAAVPEPATWAMMIGGFGLVGASVRRRAAKAAFA